LGLVTLHGVQMQYVDRMLQVSPCVDNTCFGPGRPVFCAGVPCFYAPKKKVTLKDHVILRLLAFSLWPSPNELGARCDTLENPRSTPQSGS
jgi:hypothetical protein